MTLRPVRDRDLPLLETWLNRERVLRWYHDAEEWLGEIRERDGAFAFLHHYLALADGIPIGFGQWYDCFDAREEWYAVEKPGELFSIDYLVGEDDYQGKGYGKAVVKALVGLVKQRRPNTRIVVQPDAENIASGKALLANGFVYDEAGKYYSLR